MSDSKQAWKLSGWVTVSLLVEKIVHGDEEDMTQDYAEMVLEDKANEMLLGGDYNDPEFDDEIEITKVKTETGGAS